METPFLGRRGKDGRGHKPPAPQLDRPDLMAAIDPLFTAIFQLGELDPRGHWLWHDHRHGLYGIRNFWF